MCLRNTTGIAIVTMVYILMAYEYFMTVYFGIWRQSFGLYPTPPYSIVFALINTVLFTFFFVMMVWSHIVSVRTEPGYLPEEKEQLQEELIPQHS